MAIGIKIKDGRGSENEACVTSRGEMATNDIEYSVVYFVDADVISTAYNFVPPIAGKRFVIKYITLSGDKDIGTNGSTVEIYEATSPTSTVIEKQLLRIVLPEKTNFTKPANTIVSEGVWVNIKHNDDDVFATLEGYYVSA